MKEQTQRLKVVKISKKLVLDGVLIFHKLTDRKDDHKAERQSFFKIMVKFECLEKLRVVFHFNKAHNSDSSIPMWVVKHKGVTYYVDHLDSEVGFKTKESPDNEHTKGSLQFVGCLKIVENDGKSTARIY